MRAMQFGFPGCSSSGFEPKKIRSLPWSGSVIAQQPRHVGATEALDELGILRNLRQHPRKAVDTEADRETGVSPALLLGDDAAQPRLLHGCEPLLGGFGRIGGLVEAERPVFLEHLPEDRILGDHVRWIGQRVELYPRRPHHLRGKLVNRILDRPLLVGQSGLEIDHRHAIPLLLRAFEAVNINPCGIPDPRCRAPPPPVSRRSSGCGGCPSSAAHPGIRCSEAP